MRPKSQAVTRLSSPIQFPVLSAVLTPLLTCLDTTEYKCAILAVFPIVEAPQSAAWPQDNLEQPCFVLVHTRSQIALLIQASSLDVLVEAMLVWRENA